MLSVDEIKKLKDSVENKYKTAIEKLEMDRTKELEAINIVCGLQKSFPSNASEAYKAVTRTRTVPVPVSGYGAASIIRDAIRKIGKDFNLKTIAEFVNSTDPSTDVTRGNFHAAVSGMKDSGEVIIVEQGKGKRATIYRYVKEIAPNDNVANTNEAEKEDD